MSSLTYPFYNLNISIVRMTFSFCSFFSDVQKTQATDIMIYQSFEKTVIVQFKQSFHKMQSREIFNV